MVPDLPKANYTVWARGYGLIDSPKMTTAPGRLVNLSATRAPTPAAAAHYYPAIYWYSMLKIPAADEFGGKNPSLPAALTQPQWLDSMRSNGCIGCHQIGQQSTRTIPASLGTFASTEQAWMRRVQSGQAGQQMAGQMAALGSVAFKNFADWTDRIAKGELPHATPQRPQGAERNIVVTLRDWMNEKQYLHDLIASDRRNPTVNAYGPLYGAPEVQLRRDANPRPGQEHLDVVPVAGARSPDAAEPRTRACRGARPDGAIAVLGRGTDLGDQSQQPQLDARQDRKGLACRFGPRR